MFDLVVNEWRFALALAGLATFFAWESLAPAAASKRRGLHAARNLTIAGANALLVGACCAGATAAVAALTAFQGWGALAQVDLSPSAKLLAGFVLLDAWTFWWHRANHRFGLLWRFHSVHHSDPNLDVTTAVRFHVGELLLSAGLRLLLIPLVGLPLASLVFYDGAVLVLTQFHHANIGLGDRADSLVRLLVVSPNMHKVHHSQRRIETDSNYSTVFSWWDRVFGSYRTRADYNKIQFGLAEFESERFQTLGGLLLTPFRGLPSASAASRPRL